MKGWMKSLLYGAGGALIVMYLINRPGTLGETLKGIVSNDGTTSVGTGA